MTLKLSNNSTATLGAALSTDATQVSLAASAGAKFPALDSGDWFPITVAKADDPSQFEVMRCAARSGDILTVSRAQEGTSAKAFAPGDVVELRLTAGAMQQTYPQVTDSDAGSKGVRFSVAPVAAGQIRTVKIPNKDIELLDKATEDEQLAGNSDDVGTTPLGVRRYVGQWGIGEGALPLSNMDAVERTGVYRAGEDRVALHLQTFGGAVGEKGGEQFQIIGVMGGNGELRYRLRYTVDANSPYSAERVIWDNQNLDPSVVELGPDIYSNTTIDSRHTGKATRVVSGNLFLDSMPEGTIAQFYSLHNMEVHAGVGVTSFNHFRGGSYGDSLVKLAAVGSVFTVHYITPSAIYIFGNGISDL